MLQPDTVTPPGWEHDPSSWKQRLPLVALALVGAGTASYLAAFQPGWIVSVWEPFFGDGSRQILTSNVSRVLPIPDAALGAGLALMLLAVVPLHAVDRYEGGWRALWDSDV